MATDAAILAELQALREDVQHLTRRLLPAQDRQELRELLPLVHALMGEATWSLPSLYAVATLAPDAKDLERRLEDWRTEVGGFRELGHVLMRGRGTVHHGLRLVYVGGDSEGALHTLKRVSSPAEPPAPVASQATVDEHD